MPFCSNKKRGKKQSAEEEGEESEEEDEEEEQEQEVIVKWYGGYKLYRESSGRSSSWSSRRDMFQEQATEHRTQSNKRQRGACSLQTKAWGPFTSPKTRQKRRQNGVPLRSVLIILCAFSSHGFYFFFRADAFQWFFFLPSFLFCMIIDVNLAKIY
jgi:hypothetical protein